MANGPAIPSHTTTGHSRELRAKGLAAAMLLVVAFPSPLVIGGEQVKPRVRRLCLVDSSQPVGWGV